MTLDDLEVEQPKCTVVEKSFYGANKKKTE